MDLEILKGLASRTVLENETSATEQQRIAAENAIRIKDIKDAIEERDQQFTSLMRLTKSRTRSEELRCLPFLIQQQAFTDSLGREHVRDIRAVIECTDEISINGLIIDPASLKVIYFIESEPDDVMIGLLRDVKSFGKYLVDGVEKESLGQMIAVENFYQYALDDFTIPEQERRSADLIDYTKLVKSDDPALFAGDYSVMTPDFSDHLRANTSEMEDIYITLVNSTIYIRF